MKKNSMKKNRMLRLASTLMILTLLTTSIIGGTFAKYTTTGRAQDTARVAKWGVVINTSGSLYSNAYEDSNKVTGDDGTETENGNLPTAWNTTGNTLANGISVATQENIANDNIVAPGTKNAGEGLSFSISGTPEVAVDVETTIRAEDIFLKGGYTYGVLVPVTSAPTNSTTLQSIVEANKDRVYSLSSGNYTKVNTGANWANGTKYYILTDRVEVAADYFPVDYKLGEGNSKKAIDMAEDLAKEVNTGATATTTTSTDAFRVEYTNISSRYDANTDLSEADKSFTGGKLTWEWPFSSNDNEDKLDTILGNLIADKKDATDVSGPKVAIIKTVDGNETVTELKFGNDDDEFTVTDGASIVANLRTKLDITLRVTQVD